MSNTMIDVETAGTGSNAAILTIGAVKFSGKGLGEEFYRVVDIDSCLKAGLVIEAKTFMWWLQQSEEARKALYKEPDSLFNCLKDFNKFIGDPDTAKVWGNGSDFDNVIMLNAYKAINLTPPWKFYNSRCYRTVKNLLGANIPFERVGTYHNALDDAKSQANHLVKIMAALQKGKV